MMSRAETEWNWAMSRWSMSPPPMTNEVEAAGAAPELPAGAGVEDDDVDDEGAEQPASRTPQARALPIHRVRVDMRSPEREGREGGRNHRCRFKRHRDGAVGSGAATRGAEDRDGQGADSSAAPTERICSTESPPADRYSTTEVAPASVSRSIAARHSAGVPLI